MSKTIITHPYEFLLRFHEGKLSGAHIQFIDYISEDGKITGHVIGDPKPVTEGGEFPLSEILNQAQQASFIANQELLQKNATINQLNSNLAQQLEVERGKVARALGELIETQKTLAELRIKTKPVPKKK